MSDKDNNIEDSAMCKLVYQMSGGNPGALSLLMRVYNDYRDIVFPCFCWDLQKRGLVGASIWHLYKDVHNEDFDAFVKDVWTGAPIDQLKKVDLKGMKKLD